LELTNNKMWRFLSCPQMTTTEDHRVQRKRRERERKEKEKVRPGLSQNGGHDQVPGTWRPWEGRWIPIVVPLTNDMDQVHTERPEREAVRAPHSSKR
jgi:hypothetical protein